MRSSMLVVAIALVARAALARDVYVIGGSSVSPIPGGCDFYRWTSDVVFHNANSGDAAVTWLDSTAAAVPADATLVLGGGRTTSIKASGKGWIPTVPLWVMHLRLPDGVSIESRIELGKDFCVGPPPPVGGPILGKLSFPVRSLQPAGVPMIHLGTDLGHIPARNNVAVYNAADVPATARITVRQACDDTALESRTVAVPPRSVIQANGFTTSTNCAANPSFQEFHLAYVEVVSDQPGASWVSMLANDRPIIIDYGVALGQ